MVRTIPQYRVCYKNVIKSIKMTSNSKQRIGTKKDESRQFDIQ